MVPSHAPRPRRRTRWLAGTTASALLLASAFASTAAGAPLASEHDFADGDLQGWNGYANAGAIDFTAATGELCAVVEGGTNPWDIALQHDVVTYDRDTTYTVAFDAHASAAVTVPVQGGLGYPAAFGHQVVLDGTATPQHVEFEFTPADWPTGGTSPVGDGWTTGTGEVSFQLGAQAAPYTFCLDNFSMTSDEDTPDDQGWIAYANAGSVEFSAATGELCAAASGGVNPWDIALQLDDVTYDRDTTYTVAFDAHASAAVTVPMQGGLGYPAAFGHQVVLDGTATPQHVEFEFTPADWPTGGESPAAEGWTTGIGQISFQLGGQTAPYTLCVDNFSLTSDADTSGERLVHSFTGGDLGEYDLYDAAGGGTAYAGEDGLSACIDLRGGYANAYEAGLELKHVDIVEGRNYVLEFTAYGEFPADTSDSARINVLVGQFGEPWHRVLDAEATLTTEPQTFTYAFTPDATFSSDPSSAWGRIQLELGRRAAPYTFCVTELSLVETTEAPPAYEPETGSRVRVNQVGYLPEGPKRATVVTEATEAVAWELLSGSTVVADGTTTPRGVDPTAGVNVHEIVFDDVTTPGTYTLRADGETSHEFDIDADAYQQLRYDALDYFYPARSGIEIDGAIMGDTAYSRAAGHVGRPGDATPNKGDYAVGCITPAEAQDLYGDWTCDYTLDVVGGWYDAGDHGKYVVNGGIAVAQVLSTYERALHSPTGDASALGDGSLDIPLDEQTNGVPDPLDEARWELEWMMRMQVPAGEPLAGMVHHKVHDVDWTGLPLLPADAPQERRLHRPSTAATLNFAAVAAQGARLWEPYDADFAAELLAAGQVAWASALETPDLLAPPPNADPSPGGGPYDDTDVSDEFYWAAAELFLTTGEQEFEDAVLASEHHTADIFTAGGMYWGEVAALGRMNLAVVESEIPGRTAIRQSVVDGAETYLARQAAQPFGTAYPGNDDGVYEWGSNSAVLNNQVVLGTAFDLTSDQRFADAVIESMDYLLGRNALNLSYITGYGDVFAQNQHSRWFSNSLTESLPNPPAGSVSGGPNSDFGTWDPVISNLYNQDNMCAPQLCYVDHIQSWSTNEITVNWNSALSWVASFVADQQDGDESAAGEVAWVVTDPSDVSALDGTPVGFEVEVSGSPAPTVQWQQLVDGTWTDVADATETTLTLTARTADTGAQYRAYVANEFGGAYSGPAVLTVTTEAPPEEGGAPVVPAPGSTPTPTPTPAVLGTQQPLATTGSNAGVLLGIGLLLVAAGVGAVALTRRTRTDS